MRILLCASKTPDTTTKITFSPDKKSIATSGIQYILNPYDDHGLARAMDIKEKTNGHLTVVHVGDASSKAIIDRCLAIGADEAIRINMEPQDAYSVASQIVAAIQGQQFDLIICGRESIDYSGNQVCDLLGEMLGIASVAFATDIQFEGSNATIRRFIDGGEETVSTSLPVVISATKELAEPRIPNMRGIMAARTKPTKVVEPANPEILMELVSYEAPAPKSGVRFIEASEAGKLIDILHNEEKLI